MTVKISTQLHTVFILVGPTMCGKSTFAEALFNELIYKDVGKVVLLSSDEQREILLQDLPHRYAPVMAEASEAAFKVLMARYEASISYPISSEFVIMDTTGMNDNFRGEVRSIAERHGYRTELVTFEYKHNPVYTEHSTEEEKAIVRASYKRFKTDVLPNLGRKGHDNLIRIKQRDENRWSDLEVEIKDLELYQRCHVEIDPEEQIIVIGDIHESVDALGRLIVKLHSEVEDKYSLLVSIGDYLDKGGNTEAIIEKMEILTKLGALIIDGNHESYAAKRLRGEIKNPDLAFEEDMSSLTSLLADKELADRFLKLYDTYTLPFLKIHGEHCRTLFLTHAPCQNKFLGKMSSEARRCQRNLPYSDKTKDYRHAFDFVFKEARGNFPLHAFGHIAHNADKPFYRNNIFLDTGAVYGNKLTAMVYGNNKFNFVQVQAEKLMDKDFSGDYTVPMDAPEKKFSIHDYNLSPEDMRFLNRAMKNQIRYISGTMAPAPSTGTEIESLKAGLEHFVKEGVTKLVAQPKYMGSRCQAYLYRGDSEKSFLVSRNGFKIRRTEELDGLIKKLLEEQEQHNTWNEELILDGELLPWTVLGESLVEEQFEAYAQLVDYELGTLAGDTGFEALSFNSKPHLPWLQKDLDTFCDTLELYSGRGEAYYKPFNVLAVDGVVVDPDGTNFATVSTDKALYVDLESAESIQNLRDFFSELTVEKGMEGIVLKPAHYKPGLTPYMKVRNEDYLTLVYGYDYKRRYEALCRQKRVGGKIRISIKEHELATEMLTADEAKRKELIVKMIAQLNKEKELDPRL